MKIGVDVDGVLADFNRAYIAKVKEVLGIDLTSVSASYPDIWDYHLVHLTAEQAEEVDRRIGASDSFWKELQIIDMDARVAMSHLADLADQGHDIYFITSRKKGKKLKEQTELWLRRRGFNFPTVLLTKTAADKAAVIGGLKLDMFVDDNVDNVNEVAKANPNTRVYMIQRSWNKGAKLEGVTEVGSLMKMLERELQEVALGRAA